MEPVGQTIAREGMENGRAGSLTLTLGGAKNGGDPAALREAAQNFESYFLSMLTRQMRQSLPGDSVLSGGRGEEIFQGMLDNELALRMSERGTLGIAKLVVDQVMKHQAAQAANAETKGGDSK